MATDAQNEANRKNALASTGPQTPEGKSASSRNAVSHGLFSTLETITIQPDEQNELADLSAALNLELSPAGPLEQTLATEIIRAAWRLRRCAKVEDSLTEVDPFTDPMANSATLDTQIAVDRARAQTHRLLHRSMNELRRLQNERRFRAEIPPDDLDNSGLGLTSYKDLMAPMVAERRLELLKRKLQNDQPEKTKQTQSTPNALARVPAPNPFTPRNAPCPCGSGQKHKRCCGKQAPPVLNYAA